MRMSATRTTRKKHTGKKALLATLTISKTLQQRNIIPNEIHNEIRRDEHVEETQG